MTLYIDGLSKTIQTIVARHMEIVRRLELTFKNIVHFDLSEDEAVRDRAYTTRLFNIASSNWTSRRGQPPTLPR